MLLTTILALLLTLLPQSDSTEYVAEAPPIFFRWNKTDHEREYVENRAAVESLADMLMKIGANRIKSIELTGYSSPDGVYEHNVLLSRKRAESVRSVFCKEAPELARKVHIRAGGEAWIFLRARVAQDTRISEHSRERILKFLDNTSISNDTRKWRLANWLGSDPKLGSLYSYIVKKHYPYLRCVTVEIYFQSTDDNPIVDNARRVSPPEVVMPAAESTGVAARPAATGKGPAADTTAIAASDTTSMEAKMLKDSVLAETPLQPELSTRFQQSADNKQDTLHATKPARRRDYVPVLGVSTNLLYDATYIHGYGFTSIPSLSVEYYPARGNWTVGADVEWPNWRHFDEHRYMQIHNVGLWGRYYLKPGQNRFNGWYVSGSLNTAAFGLGWNEKGWEGEGVGMSAGAGHKWTFGRIYIDAGLALGGFYSRFDSYTWGNDATGWYYYDYAGDPDEFTPRLKRWLWIGPTRLQVSLGVDLFDRNRKRK